jgi:hypothetical protein
MRKYRSRAHSPMILAHSLTTDFFGIEEREGYFPDFESFAVWPATARLLWQLREIDHLAGQSSVAHFGHWHDPASRQIILCTRINGRIFQRVSRTRTGIIFAKNGRPHRLELLRVLESFAGSRHGLTS